MSYPLHRRNQGTQAQIDNNLIVDAPLNGDGLDYSGENNHLTAGSAVTWANDGGRQVLYALNDNSYFDLLSAPASGWINKFRLEIEIRRGGSEPSYPNFVDSANSGGGSGVFCQRESTSFNCGLINTTAERRHIVTPWANIVVGNWYRLIFEKDGANVYAAIFDIANNVFIAEYTNTMTNPINSSYNLRIGRSSTYSGRYSSGFIRNLKLWKLQ